MTEGTELYPANEGNKRPWQSRTLWVNAIMAVASFVPQLQPFLTQETLGTVFLIVNTVLRFTTKTGVSIK